MATNLVAENRLFIRSSRHREPKVSVTGLQSRCRQAPLPPEARCVPRPFQLLVAAASWALGHMAPVSASRTASLSLCPLPSVVTSVSLLLSNKHLVIVFRTHQDNLGWSPRPKVLNHGCKGLALPGVIHRLRGLGLVSSGPPLSPPHSLNFLILSPFEHVVCLPLGLTSRAWVTASEGAQIQATGTRRLEDARGFQGRPHAPDSPVCTSASCPSSASPNHASN